MCWMREQYLEVVIVIVLADLAVAFADARSGDHLDRIEVGKKTIREESSKEVLRWS